MNIKKLLPFFAFVAGLYALPASAYVRKVTNWADFADNFKYEMEDFTIVLRADVTADSQAAVLRTDKINYEVKNITIDLNGHCLKPCLIELREGQTLTVTNGVGTGVVDGGGYPFAVAVCPGENMFFENVTFTNCANGCLANRALWDGRAGDDVFGGVCDIRSGANAKFRNCRFVDCRNTYEGNSSDLERYYSKFAAVASASEGSALEFDACLFRLNGSRDLYPYDISVIGGSMIATGCQFIDNKGYRSVLVFSGATVSMTDCVATNNSYQEGFIWSKDDVSGKSTFAMKNVLFMDNFENGDRERPRHHAWFGPSDTCAYSGGIFYEPPSFRINWMWYVLPEWLADDSESFEQDGRVIVGRKGTLGLAADGALADGTFTFDPSSAPYAPFIRLDPSSTVSVRQEGDERLYVVSAASGGPYAVKVGGLSITYVVRDGKAWIGDGTNLAVSGLTRGTSVVPIPDTIAGHPVVGISANAFSAVPSHVRAFVFAGGPPEVADGAFPDGLLGSYPSGYVSSWTSVGTVSADADGFPCRIWRGLKLLEAPFVASWSEIASVVGRGGESQTAILTNTVYQKGGEVLAVSNKFTLDLNGHGLYAGINGMFSVEGSGRLLVTDSSAGTRGVIRSDSSDPLAVKRAALSVDHANATLLCEGVTFEGCRRAAYGCATEINWGKGDFRDCRFVACGGGCDSVVHVMKGVAELDACLFENNELTGVDGGTVVNWRGRVTATSCRFIGNRAKVACVLASTDSTDSEYSENILRDCVATNNVCIEPGGGCVWFSGVAGTCVQENCFFSGNLDGNGLPLPAASFTQTSYVCLGGVVDAPPTNRNGVAVANWVADGSAASPHDGRLVIAEKGSLVFNAAGEICAGLFAFNPTNEPFASVLRLHPDANVVETPTAVGVRYAVKIVDGTYVKPFDGVDLTFSVRNGQVWLGDGVNPAVTSLPTDVLAVTIPDALAGYPITCISSNAFAACTNGLTVLSFAGAPPAVAAGAFPDEGVIGCYSSQHGSEWADACTLKRDAEGRLYRDWQGIEMIGTMAASWAELRSAVELGGAYQGILLTADVVQDGPMLTVTNDVALYLGGHRLSANTNGLFSVDGNGWLTVRDGSADRTGRIGSAVSDPAQVQCAALSVNHANATLLCEGVTFEGCRRAAYGCASEINWGKGVFRDCRFVGCAGGCDSAVHVMKGVAELDGCLFENNELTGTDGGPIVNWQGRVTATSCRFTGNRGRVACVLASTGGTNELADVNVLRDCLATSNVCTEATGACLWLTSVGGSCTLENGLFVDNGGPGGDRLPVATVEAGSLSCSSSVVDAAPRNRNGSPVANWAAAGCAVDADSGRVVVAAEGTLVINAREELCSGTFAFNPTNEPYAKFLRLNPDVRISERTVGGGMRYDVRLGPGPHVETFEGVEFTFTVRDGKAWLGDGVNPAVAGVPQGILALTVPETLCGLPVVGICSNAFAACTNGTFVLEFVGTPPANVEDGAFPSGLSATYPLHRATEWAAAGTVQSADGMTYVDWHGLPVIGSPFARTWAEVEAIMRGGDSDKTVCLMADVEQVGPSLSVGATNRVSLMLNGHCLAVGTNGLATVADGAGLTVFDSTGRGGVVGVKGDGLADGLAGVFRVEPSASLVCQGVNFESCMSSGTGGVAVVCGTASFTSCAFMGCQADCGGVFGVGAGGSLTAVSCRFSGNRARKGCLAAAAGGSVRFNECTATANEVTVFPGGCISLSGDATYAQKNGFFADNRAGDAPVPLAVLDAASGSPACRCSGGIVDAAPTAPDGVTPVAWIADGFAACPYAGRTVVVREGAFSYSSEGKICAGTFSFNPTREPYSQALVLHPGVRVTAGRDSLGDIFVLTVEGGPWTAVLPDGTEVAYVVRGGKAYLGDGFGPAVTNTALTRLVVPAEVDGFAVAGLEANAFGACAEAREVAFMGGPVGTVGTNALPAGASVSFRWPHAAEWRSVVVDGMWHGHDVLSPRFDDWGDIKAALEQGETATLGKSVTGTNETICLSGGKIAPTLDLNGFSLVLPHTDAAFVLVKDGAALTLADGAGGGRIVAPASPGRLSAGFRVGADGTFHMRGGTVSGFVGAEASSLVRVESNGTFCLHGGVFEGNADFGGGIVSVSNGQVVMNGGEIRRNDRSPAVAAREAGRFGLHGGRIAENRSDTGDCPVLSAEGGAEVEVWNGRICSNAVTKTLFACSDGSRLSFYGALVEGNATNGQPASVSAECGSCRVYGGVFDVAPAKTAAGFEVRSVGVRKVVAAEGTLGTANGVLTAGRFAFNPLAGEIGALRLADPASSSVATFHGTPTLYGLSVGYAVTCREWRDLQANILAGNAIIFDVDFDPEIDHKMPSGFVYRASAVGDAGPASGPLEIGLRLYEQATGGKPVWTGSTNVTIAASAEGVFQVWVSDAMSVGARTKTLEEVFKGGTGVYLGVTLGGGEECSPRRTLVTTPLANRASVAAAFDRNATVDFLEAEKVTCQSLNLAGGLCATFEIAATNAAYNISEMNVGGCTLYRHADNRILALTDGEWVERTVRPGDVLVDRAPKSGFLTIQSTSDCSVPMLAVPVPEGGSFVWQSDGFTGRYRFTCIGEND